MRHGGRGAERKRERDCMRHGGPPMTHSVTFSLSLCPSLSRFLSAALSLAFSMCHTHTLLWFSCSFSLSVHTCCHATACTCGAAPLSLIFTHTDVRFNNTIFSHINVHIQIYTFIRVRSHSIVVYTVIT